jgi:hypothetical protein
MSPTSFSPRLNHVALSVDADVMDEEGRAALLEFFSEVFGHFGNERGLIRSE